MHVLIDCTNYQALARHASYKALGALAYIQFANVDTAVVPANENKAWAQFDIFHLRSIATAAKAVPEGAFPRYGDLLVAVRQAIANLPALELPFTEAQLLAQAEAIAPEDERPYDFDPDNKRPKRATSWCVEPQRNRPRYAPGVAKQFTSSPPQLLQKPDDAQAEADRVADLYAKPWNSISEPASVPKPAQQPTPLSTHQGTHMASKKPVPVAKPAPVAAPAAKPAAKAPKAAKEAAKPAPAAKPAKEVKSETKPAKPVKEAKAPKEARVIQNDVTRPKAGGKCAQVWDIADKLSAKAKAPAQAADVIKAAVDAGLNEANARAEFQRWRKFNGLSGRTPAAK